MVVLQHARDGFFPVGKVVGPALLASFFSRFLVAVGGHLCLLLDVLSRPVGAPLFTALAADLPARGIDVEVGGVVAHTGGGYQQESQRLNKLLAGAKVTA